jgi:Rieske Fe-S protein
MSQQTSPDQAGPPEVAASRRVVLTGVGAAALAVLTGCATYDASAPAGGAGAAQPPSGRVDDTGSPDGTDPSADSGASDPVAKTADIPVGGGTVIDRQKIVITQPKKGTFKAFTAVCTHQGCVVADVSGGTINCPCHGSKFHVADGSVANGPASRPLREIDIKVDGTGIVLA